MSYYLQLVLNGIIAGSTYAMFAVGLTMVYGIFRFINFAHGELIAWSAYLTLLFIKPPFSFSIICAAIPALLITIALCLAQDRFVYHPLRSGSRVALLIASIGLSYLLRNAIRLIWGSDLMTYGQAPARGISFPGGVSITMTQITIMGATLFFLGFLYVLLTRTILGKSLRAVSDNMELAEIMGINMKHVRWTVWSLSAVFAGVGGILLALDANLEPLMGLTNLIKAFAAVLLGGLGNVWGALLGALFIGIAENVGVAFFSPGYKDFISYGLIILLLLFRPRGIFGIAKGVR